jgi:hypothetical protein
VEEAVRGAKCAAQKVLGVEGGNQAGHFSGCKKLYVVKTGAALHPFGRAERLHLLRGGGTKEVTTRLVSTLYPYLLSKAQQLLASHL